MNDETVVMVRLVRRLSGHHLVLWRKILSVNIARRLLIEISDSRILRPETLKMPANNGTPGFVLLL